jgi:NAD+ synthase (glutamine-hydrolysing)
MRIAIVQLDPVVGEFQTNLKKIEEAYFRACAERARLLVTSELAICGYPPLDLMERPEMLEQNEKALQKLMILTQGQTCALAVGHIGKNPDLRGRGAENVVSILEGGKVVFSQAKSLLPTYDVFDEARYFEPAREVRLWSCDGRKVAVAICEDLWSSNLVQGRSLYSKTPIEEYRRLGAELLISLSASPYEWGKRAQREDLHTQIALDLKIPLIFVNQVGATDEILFDGGSFAMDSQGKILGRLPFFKKSFGIIENGFESPPPLEREDQPPAEIEILNRGLVVGIQEYFNKTGFKNAILGLSGGIDSAVVAALAVRALGASNVLGVAMPSQYSSSHSLEDAEILAKNLGCRFEVRPIKFLFSTSSRELSEGRGQLASLATENLQARLRGVILMTLSNHDSSLVLTTGNKSELAMGYCTLYGDMVGALGPLGDLFKTRVYELARHINRQWKSPIPERSISKAPSAELKPNQTDQDTLPPYETLDELLYDYIEKGESIAVLEERYRNQLASVADILRRFDRNEYKRRQAAPVLKTSARAFGIGRRVPIAKNWQQN